VYIFVLAEISEKLLLRTFWCRPRKYITLMHFTVAKSYTPVWSRLAAKAMCLPQQWRHYTRACQVKWPGWKIHCPGSSPGSALLSPAYCFASVIVWTENKKCYHISPLYLLYFDGETAFAACVLRATTKKSCQRFLRKKVHPGDLAGGFSDLRMTWLLYCAGAATVPQALPCILVLMPVTLQANVRHRCRNSSIEYHSIVIAVL